MQVGDLTDDVAVVEWAGAAAFVFEGDPQNFKVTTMADLGAAEARLTGETGETRVGQGFDVHGFAAGDHVWLCGVRLPHTHALNGHSDADVALHALADAIYGALAEGDIGRTSRPRTRSGRARRRRFSSPTPSSASESAAASSSISTRR